jgi:hypothetical protein
VVFVGKTHAPEPLQSVAPQVPAVGEHAAVQQCVPLPLIPQIPFEHWSMAAHTAPGPPFGKQTPLGPGFEQ